MQCSSMFYPLHHPSSHICGSVQNSSPTDAGSLKKKISLGLCPILEGKTRKKKISLSASHQAAETGVNAVCVSVCLCVCGGMGTGHILQTGLLHTLHCAARPPSLPIINKSKVPIIIVPFDKIPESTNFQ